MAGDMIFKRYEKKYLLNKIQYKMLRNALEDYMQTDKYGKHTICNIYFDTNDFELIRTSIEKPVYKEKLRLRSYGIPNKEDTVFLEIKKKYNGVVYKRRINLKHDDAMNFIKNGETVDIQGKTPQSEQILKEISYFLSFYKPIPKMYIAYDRIALFGKEQNDFRITFDSDIRSREYDLDLSLGDYGENLLDDEMYLMEVKAPSAIPLWFADLLSDENIFPAHFSKYGRIYSEKAISNPPHITNSVNIKSHKESVVCLQAY